MRLIAEGAFVLGIDINETGLKETVNLTSNSERVSIAVVSITDEQLVAKTVNDYVTRQGRLDALINMAGIIALSLSTEALVEQFKAIIDVNLIGTFIMCRTCLPHLISSKGNIVNAASTAGLHGHPYMAAYSASKGAIIALTKSLSREYILQGVRVNAVAPGGTLTPLVASIKYPEGLDQALFQPLRLPDNRMGQPEEIASVVAMLASEDGSFINGDVIRIDGGLHA